MEIRTKALNREYPPSKPVCERDIDAIRGNRWRIKGSVRLAMGKIVTTERLERARKSPL